MTVSPLPCPPVCRSPHVSVIGAGNVGGTLAQCILERNLADVVLLDLIEGRPQALALDLMQARGFSGHHRHILGTNDYSDTANSDIVIVTAGSPRKPGMSRDDLLRINAKIVIEIARQAIAYSPEAIFIVVTNPLDVMTHLLWKVTGLPTHRVMGMAGLLDAARFETFISLELGISATEIRTMVLGTHGDLMVPLPRYSTVSGIPITDLLDPPTIDRLVERTRQGGAEIVGLMKTGSAFYAPAAATCRMVETILLNQPRILPIATYLQGEYGLGGLFLGVPTRLSCRGIDSIVELSLTPAEQEALHHSAAAIRQNIDTVTALI